MDEMTDVRHLRHAASWALAWGDPELALQAVERWEALAPQGGLRGIAPHEAGLFRARAYLALDRADAAYEVFRGTLNDVGPSTSSGVDLLCAMGEEYLRRGRLALAQSTFTEATGYAPTNVAAILGLARAYRMAGKMSEALEQYRRVLQVDPTNTVALRERDRLEGQLRSRSR
jgi:tetratricopeptide (TPR) repeat protein